MRKVSQINGTSGILNTGRLPPMEPRSPTVLVSNPKKPTSDETMIIEAKDEGIALVIRGNT